MIQKLPIIYERNKTNSRQPKNPAKFRFSVIVMSYLRKEICDQTANIVLELGNDQQTKRNRIRNSQMSKYGFWFLVKCSWKKELWSNCPQTWNLKRNIASSKITNHHLYAQFLILQTYYTPSLFIDESRFVFVFSCNSISFIERLWKSVFFIKIYVKF